jgi:uncharacterized damage-inducible protein DinB
MSVSTKINYDLWANQQILDAIKKVTDETLLTELTRLFAHLFKAQIIWYNRVQQINEKTEIWGNYTIEECASLLNDSPAMLEGIAAKRGESCSYTNSKGRTFESSVSDIFDHLIIHGQHHRAQILMILSKAGIDHPATDYIFYVRSL